MKGYVYLIENKINGHKYVGKTYNTIQERWHEHLKDAKREDKADRPIYRAINKYGANILLLYETNAISILLRKKDPTNVNISTNTICQLLNGFILYFAKA